MRTRCIFFGVIVLGLLSLVSFADAHATSLFGSKESESGNLAPFFKWNDMLERYKKRHNVKEEECTSGRYKRCLRKEWVEFLSTLKDQPLDKKVDAVNRRMNEAEYILDIVNWGIEDYWASPYQFFVKDGDCEDYAITKYMSLKIAGVPENSMRIVILQDTNLGIVHAVLAVFSDEKTYVLDNQIPQVVSDRKIHHYRPIYSINEHAWWRHL